MVDKPCEHLEKLLPTMHNLKTVPYHENMNISLQAIKYISPDQREADFRKWIAQYALPEEAVDFLVARMIDDKTLEQVAKEQSFTSKVAAHRFETWIKKTLTERGLRPKGKS
jgi:hypothetical protein